MLTVEKLRRTSYFLQFVSCLCCSEVPTSPCCRTVKVHECRWLQRSRWPDSPHQKSRRKDFIYLQVIKVNICVALLGVIKKDEHFFILFNPSGNRSQPQTMRLSIKENLSCCIYFCHASTDVVSTANKSLKSFFFFFQEVKGNMWEQAYHPSKPKHLFHLIFT